MTALLRRRGIMTSRRRTAGPPIVRSRNTSIVSTNATSHTIAMPSGVVAGDLLLTMIGVDGTPTAPTAPSGWTRLFTDISTEPDGRMSIFARLASGGSDTCIVASSANEQSYSMSWAFQVGTHGVVTPSTDIVVGTVAKGDSTSADGPAITISALKEYYCLVAYGGKSSTSVILPSAAPSGWSNFQKSTGTGSPAGALATAELLPALGTTSVNPAAVTVPSGAWLVTTLGIPGL